MPPFGPFECCSRGSGRVIIWPGITVPHLSAIPQLSSCQFIRSMTTPHFPNNAPVPGHCNCGAVSTIYVITPENYVHRPLPESRSQPVFILQDPVQMFTEMRSRDPAADINQFCKSYQRFRDIIYQIGPENSLVVLYEDLMSDRLGETLRICNYWRIDTSSFRRRIESFRRDIPEAEARPPQLITGPASGLHLPSVNMMTAPGNITRYYNHFVGTFPILHLDPSAHQQVRPITLSPADRAEIERTLVRGYSPHIQHLTAPAGDSIKYNDWVLFEMANVVSDYPTACTKALDLALAQLSYQTSKPVEFLHASYRRKSVLQTTFCLRRVLVLVMEELGYRTDHAFRIAHRLDRLYQMALTRFLTLTAGVIDLMERIRMSKKKVAIICSGSNLKAQREVLEKVIEPGLVDVVMDGAELGSSFGELISPEGKCLFAVRTGGATFIGYKDSKYKDDVELWQPNVFITLDEDQESCWERGQLRVNSLFKLWHLFKGSRRHGQSTDYPYHAPTLEEY